MSRFRYALLFICAAASAYYGVGALGGVSGEERKGHTTARGYGGPEPASGSRKTWICVCVCVVGGGGGGSWEAEDKEAGTQSFKTFKKTTG